MKPLYMEVKIYNIITGTLEPSRKKLCLDFIAVKHDSGLMIDD